ncbi:WG repeat protein [Gillisia sp. Hel_I_86]|uniref:WG repeat-containing protein n=1 Tax=Gillisia sp. Hel_I_86 TaxID=1249981 RepID=UPI0011990B16|nr:WG repeat-containing protein [Gillisia sp. Hel_I_86]TVZ27574.1 WG repeat protein [Gillisia sp. Hel_I_86]
MRTTVFTFGLIILSCLGFAQDIKDLNFIAPFKEGLAAVQRDGDWGFIDESGALVIDFRKDVVILPVEEEGKSKFPYFKEGMCLIQKTVKDIPFYGFMDTSGTIVIDPVYINATNFKDGMAIVGELTKESLGRNDLLDKRVVNYSFSEIAIDKSGKLLYFLTDPQHVTLDKKYLRKLPKIKSTVLNEKLIAVPSKTTKNWTVMRLH